MKIKRNRQKYAPNLDITSLIDVVFLLLVFLLVTMTFNQTPPNPTEEAIIDIELASGSSIESEKPKEMLTLLVNEDGKVFIEKDPVPHGPEELKLLLSEKLVASPDLAVNIRADHRATHGAVVAAMDQLKALKINHVNLVIELKKSE